MKQKLFGVVPPIITPVDEYERVDEKGLRLLIDHCIDHGIHGIFVCGSNGECMALTQAERDRAQAEQMRRNAEIADRIHDAVTGDLALAAVMKQQEMERDDCPNRDLLVQINERVQMALANVHRVIGPA